MLLNFHLFNFLNFLVSVIVTDGTVLEFRLEIQINYHVNMIFKINLRFSCTYKYHHGDMCMNHHCGHLLT